ncbi:uncharacterized protein LOC114119229 [Aphis gossypii]|uniref:uncharacterized protein LOC114119229 n=1 Tax=Aphis gossypii TaxID=80765 RepID=UPI002158DBD3|nr:uncharacterized protein LOC114119229 [Aphis gossypii]
MAISTYNIAKSNFYLSLKLTEKMFGNKCQYVNCGKSKKLYPNLRFYCFPNNKSREMWIINSGNTSLFTIEPEKLPNRYICEGHFPPDSFKNFSIKQRLISTAVSYNCIDNFEKKPCTSSNFDKNHKSGLE